MLSAALLNASVLQFASLQPPKNHSYARESRLRAIAGRYGSITESDGPRNQAARVLRLEFYIKVTFDCTV